MAKVSKRIQLNGAQKGYLFDSPQPFVCVQPGVLYHWYNFVYVFRGVRRVGDEIVYAVAIRRHIVVDINRPQST